MYVFIACDVQIPTDYRRNYSLSLMCPFKKYKQRKHVTPWMTPAIYRAMRERDAFICLFKQTGYPQHLESARRCRNSVNGLIYKAKSDYIKNQLNQTTGNPKKCWRIIKSLMTPNCKNVTNANFVHP